MFDMKTPIRLYCHILFELHNQHSWIYYTFETTFDIQGNFKIENLSFNNTRIIIEKIITCDKPFL